MTATTYNPDDNNSRLTKRQRLAPSPPPPPPLTYLPPSILLISLPFLLLHPPGHRLHGPSLTLSLHALRTCLRLPNLDSDIECRAWTGIAELGIMLGRSELNEVEKAVTKAHLIAQKHPSLRPYKSYLTLLSAHLASNLNPKFAQTTIRRVLVPSNDPPHIIYAAHLALISNNAGHKALGPIQDMHALAYKNNHHHVALLARVIRLRTLMENGIWDGIRDTLTELGVGVGDKLEAEVGDTALRIHVLIIAVAFYTHVGDYKLCSEIVGKLHVLLDNGGLDSLGPSGIIQIPFYNGHPLYVQTTHPRIIYILVFLLTSVAKRDPVGRKPKRRVFAAEGLAMAEKEMRKEIRLPRWATTADLQEIDMAMKELKADLLCELVGVAIARSEFDEAEQHLSNLIAHTRTINMFPAFSARITLHHAHLAHAVGDVERALKCYRVAAYLTEESMKSEASKARGDSWVNVAARAGEVWIRVGLLRNKQAVQRIDAEWEAEMEELRQMGQMVMKDCAQMGGTLRAVGEVLKACFELESLRAKSYLRTALDLTTAAADNHLRALVLSLVAAHYEHTARDHAEAMLGTSEQLAAGLGAQPQGGKGRNGASQDEGSQGGSPAVRAAGDGVGNAHLRLWIGERRLALSKRSGEKEKAQQQEVVNIRLREAVEKIGLQRKGPPVMGTVAKMGLRG